MTCSLCHNQATVLVYGKFKNGRETKDPRCATHAPDLPVGPVESRQWAFLGTTNKLVLMTDIDTIRPGQ